MSNKRRRRDFTAGAISGGLYDFIPQPVVPKPVEIEDDDDDVVAVVEPKESRQKDEDKSKVIFLDIDGVLKPEGETERVMVDGELTPILPKVEDSNFNKISLMSLRMIVQRTGARLVLSSEWRRTEMPRDAIGLSFRKSGIPQIISQTTVKEKLRP